MSATATIPDGATETFPAPLHDTLEEIVRGVHGNGDALSMSLDLLRRIIELLLPKATGDGPTLAELLAAVLATMRELLLVERANAAGIHEVLQRLDTAGFNKPQSQQKPNGSHRP